MSKEPNSTDTHDEGGTVSDEPILRLDPKRGLFLISTIYALTTPVEEVTINSNAMIFSRKSHPIQKPNHSPQKEKRRKDYKHR